MTVKELDMASPGQQRENKSKKKSLTNAELTIEVGWITIDRYSIFYFHRCVFLVFTQVYKKHFNSLILH